MIIYKITSSINGKVYIGQTVQRLSNRKGLHLFHLRNNKHPNKHLQSSFNKYREDNFIFEVIYIALSIKELNIKEKDYIEQFNSLDRTKGYNIRNGGLNESLTQSHKDSISNALIGNKNGQGNKGISKPRKLGLYHTQETKDKIKNSLLGHKRSKESIEKTIKARQVIVLQYDLNDNFIAEFSSLLQAAESTGANKNIISLCLSGKKKTSGGFKWRRKISNSNI